MRKIILALAMLMASSAQADVVYTWEWDPSVERGLQGELIVTDDAWRSGSVQWNSDDHYPDFSSAPIIYARVFMGGDGHIDGGDWNIESDPDLFRARFDIRFVGGGIEGSMYLEMIQEGVSAGSGSISTWTFLIANTAPHFDSPCFGDVDNPEARCEGTGRWILDRSTAPVSLPGTLALMGLGVILAARHRKAGRTRRTGGSS